MKQHQTSFTGYYGIWSAVSRRFVFGIQETNLWKARKRLRKEIGSDSLKWRFSVKKIKDCSEHIAMFRSGLKRKKTPDSNRALRNELCTNQYTTKREETYMNITIKIDAPELVGALESLALALSGSGLAMLATAPSVDSMMKEGQADTKVAAPKKKVQSETKETPVATKTLYFCHTESDSVFTVAKGEEYAHLELVEEITKAEYTKLKALQSPALAEAEDTKEEETESDVQTISLDVVRGKLADLSAQGKAQQMLIQDALARFGVKRLTDVDAKDYAELLEMCGVAQ